MASDALLELAARCEKASGPDREIDLAIWRSMGGVCPPGKQPLPWLHCHTSSLDAITALVREKLPGWAWTVYGPSETHGPRAALVHPDRRVQIGCDGATPELALNAAFLRALALAESDRALAQEKTNGR